MQASARGAPNSGPTLPVRDLFRYNPPTAFVTLWEFDSDNFCSGFSCGLDASVSVGSAIL